MAGDVDGDGVPDLLIGATSSDRNGTDAGAWYLFYGLQLDTVELSTADAIFVGEAASDQIGEKGTLNAFDLDGDGYDDLLFGAIYNDDGGSDTGAAYLIYGGGL